MVRTRGDTTCTLKLYRGSTYRVRVVGIGGTASSRGPVYELVRALRTLESRVTIVLGGPFATALHPQLLRWLDIDFVVPVPVLGKLAENLAVRRNERGIQFSLLNVKEILES